MIGRDKAKALFQTACLNAKIILADKLKLKDFILVKKNYFYFIFEILSTVNCQLREFL